MNDSHKDETGSPENRPIETIATINVVATSELQRFDYAALDDPALAADARATRDRIRARWTRLHSSVREIGRDLIDMKGRMGHGNFGRWIAAEFNITIRTAENYMKAAKFAEGKSESISFLPPSAIYALAAPSAPPEIVEEVLAPADAGTVIPMDEIRQKLNASAAARRKPEAVRSAEPLKRESDNAKHGRAADAPRRQKDEEEHEVTENAKALSVAQFLFARLAARGVAELLSLLDNGTEWGRVEKYLHWFYEQQPSADEIETRFGPDAQS